MSNLDPLRNLLRDPWSSPASNPTPTGAPSSTSAPSTPAGSKGYDDAAEAAALAKLPAPSVALATVVARMDPVGAKLDQVQAAASGPYVVNGKTVYSGAQFRMTGGFNEAAADDTKLRATLKRVADGVGLGSSIYALQHGYADARSLVRVTQALIDDGQLPSASTRSLPDQIHDLQWRFGMGLDCAGYVHQAVAAVHGDPSKLGLAAAGSENFTGLPRNTHFARVAKIEGVRPGDVLVLEGSGAGDPGHNLIVRSHATIEPPGEFVVSRWPGASVFINPEHGAPDETVHVFEVDSSFGAHRTGDPDCGVRRDVVLYDTATKLWMTCRSTHPPTTQVGEVPFGEKALTGFFRPKVTP